MEWYGPLTILPAVALIILSTSGFIIELNKEISVMEKEKNSDTGIIKLKIKQLKRLGTANGFLYGSALIFLVAGIIKMLFASEALFLFIMLLGVVAITIALTFLFIHSVKSIHIRQKHLQL